MKREPRWEVIRTFAAVMRAGSLSGAARSLGLTQPSVSRHIDELERDLAAKLFVRSHRGLSPTDRALALAPYAENLVTTVAALLRAASASPDIVEGRVRVTAAQAVAVGHLPPILAALRRQHPRLSIELVASDALDDLLARRADIAVRMVEPLQQALVSRRVGAVTLGLHASRDYLAHRGMPGSPSELADHDVIGPDTATPFVRALLAKLPFADHDAFALRSDSDVVHLAAIRAGVGIGIAQVELARADPSLVRVLADDFAHELPLWVVMHEDLRTSTRCRVVFDALVARLAALTDRTRSDAAGPSG